MRILAFETSSSAASVAIMNDCEILAQYTLNNTKTHSEMLMKMASHLLDELSMPCSCLDAIAVDIGPGSFTGVRIGVCAANAMAMALSIPVIGIDAPRVLYQNVCLHKGSVCVLIDARNENVYTATYENGETRVPPSALTLEEAIVNLPPSTLFVGDGAAAYKARIEGLSTSPIFVPAHYNNPSAGALLQATADCSLDDLPREVAPLYLRPSQAERMWAVHQQAKGGS